MIPTRFGSAAPAFTTASTHETMSFTAFTRSAPLSRFTNRLPKPDEPRTFGAKTAIPWDTSA